MALPVKRKRSATDVDGGENAEKFKTIVKETVKLNDPGYGQKHVDDRATAIHQFVKDVVQKVEEKTPQLRVSEILPVGGFNEGTKIKSADEFDVLVVVDELSRPGAVTVVRDESTLPGNVKLQITPGTDPDNKWAFYTRDGYLRCFEEVRQTSIEDSFGYQVLKAIPKLEQNRDRSGLRTNANCTFYGKPEDIVYSRSKPAEHIAMIKQADVRYPNVLLKFFFNGEEVTTDLCPAIRYRKVEELFNQEFCFNEELANEVTSKGSILLVAKGNLQFRVTYTETEVDYMKNKISKDHKDLYIFLKVIAGFFDERRESPTSYQLKVTCIKHDLVCRHQNDSKNILQCFDAIMDDIINWNISGDLPSIFDSRLNLLSVSFDIRAPTYRRDIVAPTFQQIRELCHNLTELSTEQFIEQVKSTVESWDKRCATHKELQYVYR